MKVPDLYLDISTDSPLVKSHRSVQELVNDATLMMAQEEVINKAEAALLTKDKGVAPQHQYAFMEGDKNNPQFYYNDDVGNYVRYTNAPTGHPDQSQYYGDAELHSSEPDFTKNPEYFTLDGRKLTRCPECDLQQVQWNDAYNRYDPQNMWMGKWVDPATGKDRYTYVASDIRYFPQLNIHQQNSTVDVRLPAFRQYVSQLFGSGKIKDQMTAVCLALLDQGRMRVVELTALTPANVQIDGNFITLGGRKIHPDQKLLGAIETLVTTTPADMPLFSVPTQGREDVDGELRRRIGPHYLQRVLDTQGIPLLGLQTYHGTMSFSREMERLLTQYQMPWEQAMNQALMVVALEWGHDFSMEPDPSGITQLVGSVLVDPVVMQVLQANAEDQGLIGMQPAMPPGPGTIPIPVVSLDLLDRTSEEKEFSNWLHNHISAWQLFVEELIPE